VRGIRMVSILVVLMGLGCGGPKGGSLADDTVECSILEQASGESSGFERCERGSQVWVNRGEAVECDSELRDAVPACDGSYESSECGVDSDCGMAGYCALGEYGWCVCETSCETDDDCGAGGACFCQVDSKDPSFGTLGECRTADCLEDSDCDSAECGASFYGPCSLAGGAFCRAPDDECRSDTDCAVSGEICMHVDGLFRCSAEYASSCE
jgi:hypothetical protein